MTTNLTIEREIPPDERDRAIESLARLIRNYLPGTRLLVTVERKKRERSDLQNRALFGCAYKALRDQTGNDADDLHNYFCGEFFGWAKHIVMKKREVTARAHYDEG